MATRRFYIGGGVNLIVELTPGSGVYNILVVDDALFAVTPLGDGMYNYAWDRSIGMRIVQDQLVPGYPGSLPPPVTGTVWTPGSPTSWTTRSYLLSDLTAPGFYPNAALHNASSGDGGSPKAPTVLGGFTICMGDSNNGGQV